MLGKRLHLKPFHWCKHPTSTVLCLHLFLKSIRKSRMYIRYIQIPTQKMKSHKKLEAHNLTGTQQGNLLLNQPYLQSWKFKTLMRYLSTPSMNCRSITILASTTASWCTQKISPHFWQSSITPLCKRNKLYLTPVSLSKTQYSPPWTSTASF